MERVIIANAYVSGEIWVEAISGEVITWDGIPGWKFYYRLSGLPPRCCEWDFFLYTNTYKKFYYKNYYISGQCENVSLRKQHRISQNMSLYNLCEVAPPEEEEATTTEDSDDDEHFFTCEPPMITTDIIEDLLKSFSHSNKVTQHHRHNDVIVDRDSLGIFAAGDGGGGDSCKHAKKIIRAISIHPTKKYVKFIIEKQQKKKMCGVCKIKRYLKEKETPYVLFTPNVSSFIMHIL